MASQFAGRVDSAAIANANRQYYGYWHYCAALAWLSRADANTDRKQAEWEYHQAIAETMFNFQRSSPTHPLRGQMSTTLGLAYRGLRDWVNAERFLSQSIEESPTFLSGYAALGMLYRETGDLHSAKRTLESGLRIANGDSAELHYFLGFVLLDLGDVEGAKAHAEAAYRQGYPLPGLKRRIERLDR